MPRKRKKDLGKANKSRRKKLTAYALTLKGKKVALGCWYYKELLKTLKVAQKLPSTIYFRYFRV